MLYAIQDSLGQFTSFAVYFGLSLLLLMLFIGVYILITPHREFALIREGKTSATISLGGALLGFSIPLASTIINSLDLIDTAVWGVIALLVQIIAFVLCRLVFPKISEQIEQGEIAQPLALAIFSVTCGIINAACISY